MCHVRRFHAGAACPKLDHKELMVDVGHVCADHRHHLSHDSVENRVPSQHRLPWSESHAFRATSWCLCTRLADVPFQVFSPCFRRIRWRLYARSMPRRAALTQVIRPSKVPAHLAFFAAHHAAAVLLAWGLTCIIFLTLTIFTFQSKIDFSFMGGFLSCGAHRNRALTVPSSK